MLRVLRNKGNGESEDNVLDPKGVRSVVESGNTSSEIGALH